MSKDVERDPNPLGVFLLPVKCVGRLCGRTSSLPPRSHCGSDSSDHVFGHHNTIISTERSSAYCRVDVIRHDPGEPRSVDFE